MTTGQVNFSAVTHLLLEKLSKWNSWKQNGNGKQEQKMENGKRKWKWEKKTLAWSSHSW